MSTKYKPLKLLDLFETVEVTEEETLESKTLGCIAEKRYKEILSYVAETELAGELVIRLKVLPSPKPGKLKFEAKAVKKLKEIKNDIEVTQGDDGEVYFDNPNQLPLEGVHPDVTGEKGGKKEK